MSQKPKVSVIIPCYNMGSTLDEAVESVLAQTMQDFEIIIVDDGSTDPDTQNLLTNYQRPKTNVIFNEHQGLAVTRNTAIKHAQGQYFSALDSDDRFHPTYLERATSILDKDPSLTFVSSWIQYFGTRDDIWKQERCDLPTLLAEDTVMTAALVRAEAVREIGGYDINMPDQGDEDWDLWISLVERGHRGTIIPEVLFDYRIRPGSMCETCTTGNTHLRLVKYIMEKHKDSYQKYQKEVLASKQAEIAELLNENDHLERSIHDLESDHASRKNEVTRLEQKLSNHPNTTQVSTPSPSRNHELQAKDDEIQALRSSWSWRITKPIRSLCDLWIHLRS